MKTNNFIKLVNYFLEQIIPHKAHYGLNILQKVFDIHTLLSLWVYRKTFIRSASQIEARLE